MIDDIIRSQIFSPADRALCETLGRITGENRDEVLLALLLASWSVSRGHLCLDLEEYADRKLATILDDDTLDTTHKLPGLKEWITFIESSPLAGKPGEYKPLILDRGPRLYLYRYWLYESVIAERISCWINTDPDNIDTGILSSGLDRYFPCASGNPDWQRVAAMAAMYHPFTVISGGPGTGKTTTVVFILLLMIEQAIASGRKPRIVMAAPTGKAASRLMEAINITLENKKVSDTYLSLIPREAHTIHRLLKIYPGLSSPYNATNPLPAEIVVIDESSMIDVSLMVSLMNAIGPGSRLILLGDRDQLASVEAGSVFGDICDRGKVHAYSAEFIARAGLDYPAVENPHKLADSLVILQKVYRYSPESGIAALSTAVREGDQEKAIRILESGNYPDLLFRPILSDQSMYEILREHIVETYDGFTGYKSACEALENIYDFMILSPLRSGNAGIDRINNLVEQILEQRGLIRADRRFYHGRPVMVRGNDYPQRLFNGDIGVVWNDEKGCRIYFNGPENSLKNIIPVKLPDHETVYAMTVHKSQGSEFREIVLVLPQVQSPVMTRELLYTAISRAKERLIITGTEEVIRSMIEQPVGRTSGLRDRIWN